LRGKHLVNTGQKETRLEGDLNLFLGSWCLDLSEEELVNHASVMDYHWDDRKKLRRDYVDIQNIYAEFIIILAKELNSYHQVNHTHRYWRILIGPWLNYFISIVFDRFAMLSIAFKEKNIVSYSYAQVEMDLFIPNGMQEFSQMMDKDSWNQVIYQDLINEFISKKYEINKIDTSMNRNFMDSKDILPNSYKSIIKNFLSKLSVMLSGPKEVYIQSAYLSFIDQIKLQMRLKIFPRFWFQKAIKKYDSTIKERNPLFEENILDEEIIKVLKYMISRHIPKSYLEGYLQLKTEVKKSPLPIEPASIFTCDSYGYDDAFKLWSAEQVENGSRLIIGQHGGHYGIGLLNADEEHQILISDKFLSWGWTDSEKKNISKVGLFSRMSKKENKKDGDLILVSTNFSRYSYRLFSVPLAGQWHNYFSIRRDFIELLPETIRESTILRLYNKDYGREEKQRWLNKFPNIKIDSGKGGIEKLYKNGRLIVHDYNASSFLETLALNYPTVIFWDKSFWEIRPEAKDYFQELKRMGIFHDSSLSAANHIKNIWDDVDGWWYEPSTQAARERFCKNYVNKSEDTLTLLTEELLYLNKI
jgi:putative transferase (TIGR04331 family)